MLSFFDNYLHEKRIWLCLFKDIDDERILQSDWTRIYFSHTFETLTKLFSFIIQLIFHSKLFLMWPNHKLKLFELNWKLCELNWWKKCLKEWNTPARNMGGGNFIRSWGSLHFHLTLGVALSNRGLTFSTLLERETKDKGTKFVKIFWLFHYMKFTSFILIQCNWKRNVPAFLRFCFLYF